MKKQEIVQKIAQETANLGNPGRMLQGSINSVKGKTDKVIYQLTCKKNGKTSTIYIRSERLEETKQMIVNYQKAKATLAKILELNATLFKLESVDHKLH